MQSQQQNYQKIFISKTPSARALIWNSWSNFASGRSNGKITVRHKGGGANKKYRILDTKRALWNVKGIVHSFEYNPVNTTMLALVYYPSCELLSFIVAPDKIKIGDSIQAGEEVPIMPGNATLLKNIPLRLKIHNLEGAPFSGAKYCRSAGTWAMIITKTEVSALVSFSNGKSREFSLECMATIGVISTIIKGIKKLKQKNAGTSRLLGIRPSVRGVAMNPVDHPHGGGNGKKSPKAANMSPWRKLNKGKKTVRR